MVRRMARGDIAPAIQNNRVEPVLVPQTSGTNSSSAMKDARRNIAQCGFSDGASAARTCRCDGASAMRSAAMRSNLDRFVVHSRDQKNIAGIQRIGARIYRENV